MAGAAPIQRIGDANNGGGIIVDLGHRNVLVNGRPAAKPYALVTPHKGCGKKNPLHCLATTLSFPSSVRINGIPVVVTGAPDSCSHTRSGGSPNVVAAGGGGLLGKALSIYNAASSLPSSPKPLDIQPGEGL